MNVYSLNAVPNVVESIVSLNVATTESPGFLLTFAVTGPDGVPAFFSLTFHDLRCFPTNTDEALNASSPSLTDAPVLMALALLPGMDTL